MPGPRRANRGKCEHRALIDMSAECSPSEARDLSRPRSLVALAPRDDRTPEVTRLARLLAYAAIGAHGASRRRPLPRLRHESRAGYAKAASGQSATSASRAAEAPARSCDDSFRQGAQGEARQRVEPRLARLRASLRRGSTRRPRFRFLDGASLRRDLVDRAAALGLPAVALLDTSGVYGAPRFHKAAKQAGIRRSWGRECSRGTYPRPRPPSPIGEGMGE